MRLIILIIFFTSLYPSDNFRTITRTTPIISKDGILHNQIKDFGEYHALLIYVKEYKILKNLKTPKEDIEALAKILQDRYCFDKSNIHILANPKNHDELVGKLDELKNSLKRNDNLLIYYAGHGSIDVKTQKGYWNLSNSRNISISRVGSISLDEAVTNTLKTMRSRHILIVSDSCYSGVLTRDSEKGSFGTIDKQEMKYYSKLYDIQSRTVLTSGGLEPVQDGDTLNSRHSVFSNSFLKMLQDNQNAIFALNEKYKDIRLYVWNGAKQTPTYEGLRLSNHQIGGDFIFIDKLSLYANKNILKDRKEKIPSFVNIKIDKIDTILVWLLAVISFLLLILSIIYFRTRKKIPIMDNDTIKEVTPNSSIVKPLKNKISKNNKGVLTMGTVTYQNQPFTKRYTWQEAKEYAQNLRLGGFDDWRLPSLKELRALGNIELYDGEDDALWNEWYQNNKDNALVNSKGEKHFIHEKLIENMPKESIFWTIESKDEDDIYMVAFNLGCNYVDYSTSMYYILCVRDNK